MSTNKVQTHEEEGRMWESGSAGLTKTLEKEEYGMNLLAGPNTRFGCLHPVYRLIHKFR